MNSRLRFSHRAGNKRLRKTMKNRSTVSTAMATFQKKVTLKFIEMLNTVKLYHWKTYSYPTHKATDELYSKLNESIDQFIEVLLGKTGSRTNLLSVKSIPLKDFSNDAQIKREVTTYKEYLVNLDNEKALKTMTNSDLYNIRDEILGHLNQFLYLMTLS